MSLRARLLLVGVTGVAVALAIGSLVLYAVLAVALERTIDSSARATASDVVSTGRGRPAAGPAAGLRRAGRPGRRRASRVVSASVNADRLTPLLRPAELRARRRRRDVDGAGLPRRDHRAAARRGRAGRAARPVPGR